MNVYGQWPNVERLLLTYLKQETGVTVYTETPSNLETRVPAVVVERIPGGFGEDYEKTFVVDVTAFAATRGAVWDLVQKLEVAMVRCPLFDEVREPDSFGMVAYSNPALRRAVGTYELDARPQ
ncbi:hypothetical protein Csp2054_09110 [Curtobacterium sp. 'Ferrero']|uniref:hypothetical protein n=1 Tax=Curtobacterium sp. 'Ferrero' TaxID=2033654 RepID=UPI000BD68E57|nr:hypothetical protein [Curtobacterium sp. 'Ferrero']PCN48022.1 hypothetical protein Csp2054_09110 [Curtobacterium sp. 'Ferrero']